MSVGRELNQFTVLHLKPWCQMRSLIESRYLWVVFWNHKYLRLVVDTQYLRLHCSIVWISLLDQLNWMRADLCHKYNHSTFQSKHQLSSIPTSRYCTRSAWTHNDTILYATQNICTCEFEETIPYHHHIHTTCYTSLMTFLISMTHKANGNACEISYPLSTGFQPGFLSLIASCESPIWRFWYLSRSIPYLEDMPLFVRMFVDMFVCLCLFMTVRV